MGTTKETLQLHEQFCKTCSGNATWCAIAQGIVKHEADESLQSEIRELRSDLRRVRQVKDEAVEQKEQFLRSIVDYRHENRHLLATIIHIEAVVHENRHGSPQVRKIADVLKGKTPMPTHADRDPKLDEKFHGIVVKSKDDSIVPPSQWFIMLAKDNAVPATLAFYRQELVKLGAGDAQLAGIDDVIRKVNVWRERHPELCKVPDVEHGELP